MNIDLVTFPFAYVDPGSGGVLFQILFIIFTAFIGFIAVGKKMFIQALLAPVRYLKKIFTSRGAPKK